MSHTLRTLADADESVAQAGEGIPAGGPGRVEQQLFREAGR